ncbi:TrmH family RNA methyltransferase [Phocaeicola faecicola]|jgi:TrmH family RNA methyltransferase|uniref:TrmH family RNA methyltransferase n=1 Tax=Phocaeicola faecicola TaxID=2739389 RepID=UPI0015B46709|nr:RNA methyltransferase [Phocaeicola faecicola]
MLSKNKIKYIRSLELKKNRKQEQAFLAEGNKLVGDLLGIFPCRLVVATGQWLEEHAGIQADEVYEVSREELSKVSLLKTPQEVLAVFGQPEWKWTPEEVSGSLCLALDDVQDPGNLGTIVRIADWFGIEHVFCSTGTVDIYNPKAIQATMGAVARVKLHYVDLEAFIRKVSERDVPVYGTFLDGENLYEHDLQNRGVIVMGNEGNGISREIAALVNRKVLIPNYPQGRETSESLNVAVATAVVCSEFRRRATVK